MAAPTARQPIVAALHACLGSWLGATSNEFQSVVRQRVQDREL